MKIVEVRVYARPLTAVRGYAMSESAVRDPLGTVVEVECDSGLVGFGEVCLATPTAQPETNEGVRIALERLAPAVLGHDPTNLRAVHAAMNAALDGSREAKAAIDIACWDLFGKAVDLPLHRLLGGAVVEQVATYHVVGLQAPDEAAVQAEQLQAAGLRKFQLKVGGRAIAEDIAAIKAVASVLRPETELAADANRGWTALETEQVSQACRDVRMSIEQPCRTWDECVGARANLAHPMLLDELMTDVGMVVRAAASGLVAGLGMKTSRVGGLAPMLAIRDIATAAGMHISTDDAWGGDIVAAAGVHLGATVDPRVHRGSWIALPYHEIHDDPVNGPRIVDGAIAIPAAGPGLGLALEPGFLGEPVAVVSSAD